MTREEKIRTARELYAEGLTASQISARLGAPTSTIRNWYLGGDCKDCGAPINGGNPGRQKGWCRKCAKKVARLWTTELIVNRIREWNAMYGEPPTATDWNHRMAHPARRAEVERRFRGGHWPHLISVQKAFGSWNAAIGAAGFEPRRPGCHGPRRIPLKAAA